MVKATFKIKGDNLMELLTQSLVEFQDDEFTVQYQFESGIVFMFEQKKRSVSNFALNVILDNSIVNQINNEFTVRCYALGEKDSMQINLMNIEKSTIKNLRYHMFGFSCYVHRSNYRNEICQ